MNTKSAKWTLLALIVIFSCLDGYFAMRQSATPRVFDLVFAVVFIVISYAWYRQDSAARRYQGSSLMGGAIILFTAVAVPVYIYKSRPHGERGRSLLHLLRFVGLCILASLLVGVVFSLAA